ncbi:MAG: DUF4956 domain-containing protein [Planctomycetota bacterium]
MPEWMRDLMQGAGTAIPVHLAALRLFVAVVAGLVIAWVYRRCVSRAVATNDSFAMALVLLSTLVAMTTMVIGDNVARAFSLVGALAIVRFRTDVEDTRDTAFVIFAVVAGMAAGVGNWGLCAVGVPIVGVVALARAGASRIAAAEEGPGGGGPTQPLLVRIGTGDDPKAELEPAMKRHLEAVRLVRTATARQGAALELTYSVRLRAGSEAVPLVRELNAVKGVQHVELGEA